jgi:preprotein translocase subunit SecA
MIMLARRDVQWMGPIYHALGLSVASIVHDTSFLFDSTYLVKDYGTSNLRPIERKDAISRILPTGRNNEFGFDYLRDKHEILASTTMYSVSYSLPLLMRSTIFWSMKLALR